MLVNSLAMLVCLRKGEVKGQYKTKTNKFIFKKKKKYVYTCTSSNLSESCDTLVFKNDLKVIYSRIHS